MDPTRCRACLNIGTKTISLYNSSEASNGIVLSEILNFVPHLNLSEEDDFPKVLCSNCAVMVLQFVKLTEMIARSDEYLSSVRSFKADAHVFVKQELPAPAIKLDEDSDDFEDYVNDTSVDHNESKENVLENSITLEAVDAVELKKENTGESTDYDYTRDATWALDVNLHTGLVQVASESPLSPSTKQEVKRQIGRLEKRLDPTRKFSCDECTAAFRKQGDLQDHIYSVHLNLYRYQCNKCEAKYKNRGQLSKHRILCDNPDSYKCSACFKLFATTEEYERHYVRKHVKEPIKNEDEKVDEDKPTCTVAYKCDICGAQFKTKKPLETHMIKKHDGLVDEKPSEVLNESHIPVASEQTVTSNNTEPQLKTKLICLNCNGVFASTASFKKHHDRKHSNIPEARFTKTLMVEPTEFPCEYCKEIFETQVQLRAHLRTHKRFVCDHCGHAFKRVSDLKDHVAGVHLSLTNTCDICGFQIKSRSGMVRHKRSHHNPPEKTPCEICGKPLVKESLALHHRIVHLKERNWMCPICGMAFSLRQSLNKHVARHNKARPRSFECDICSLTFLDKTTMVRHVQVKHFHKRVHCKLCNRGYTTSVGLKKHMESHARGKVRVRNVYGLATVKKSDDSMSEEEQEQEYEIPSEDEQQLDVETQNYKKIKVENARQHQSYYEGESNE